MNTTLRSGPLTQRRRYKNPPIEEALCEFGFAPGPDWDPTIPGKLQAELGDEYSGKPREQRAVKVGLHVQKGKPADFQYDEGLAESPALYEIRDKNSRRWSRRSKYSYASSVSGSFRF